MNDVELTDWREEIINRIHILFDADKYEAVIAVSMELLEDDPEDWEGLIYMSRSLLLLENYHEADELIRKLISAYPDSSIGYMLIGDLHHNTNRHDEAISYYEQCIEMEPEVGYNYFSLASALFYGAEKQKLIRKIPCYSFNPVVLARIQRAIDTLYIAIQHDYENTTSYCLLAQCYEALGRPEDGYECVREAIIIDPTSSYTHQILSSYYLNHGDLHLASSHIGQALKFEPQNNDAIQFQELIKSLQLNPHDYYRFQLQYWKKLCKLYPDNADYWLKLIHTKLLYGKHQPIKEFRAYLGLIPEDLEMQITYGKALYDDCRYRTAELHFRRLYKEKSGNPYIGDWLDTLSKVGWLKVYVYPVFRFILKKESGR